MHDSAFESRKKHSNVDDEDLYIFKYLMAIRKITRKENAFVTAM